MNNMMAMDEIEWMSHAKLGAHFKVKRDMKISELADRAGVVSSAIGDYERARLLSKAARDGNGYRRDAAAAPVRIHFIRIGQTLGFALDAIRAVITPEGKVPQAEPMKSFDVRLRISAP
jgi:DNA-binding transcriptional MerR regulator